MEFENILKLIDSVSNSGLSVFSLEQGDTKLVLETVRKPSAQEIAMAHEQAAGIVSAYGQAGETVLENSSDITSGSVSHKSSSRMSGNEPDINEGRASAAGNEPDVTKNRALGNAPDKASDNTSDKSFDELSEDDGVIVKSPLVGIFYNAPSPDDKPYVSVGDHVKKGQVIGIIEAMKLMNEIEAEADGVVTKIYLENGQTAEYGEPVICIGRE